MSERLTDQQLGILWEQWPPAADELFALRAENERLRVLLGDLVALIDWTISPEFQAHIDAVTKGGKP